MPFFSETGDSFCLVPRSPALAGSFPSSQAPSGPAGISFGFPLLKAVRSAPLGALAPVDLCAKRLLKARLHLWTSELALRSHCEPPSPVPSPVSSMRHGQDRARFAPFFQLSLMVRFCFCLFFSSHLEAGKFFFFILVSQKFHKEMLANWWNVLTLRPTLPSAKDFYFLFNLILQY